MILPSWLEYLIFSQCQSLLVSLLFSFFHADPSFSLYGFISQSQTALALLVLAFSLIEKTKKEQFVIGITNAKTKKLMI